jgi:hypothetical protein
MTVNNLSTNLNSSANSGSQQMGTPALAKASVAMKALSTIPASPKGSSGVDVSISSKAIAAYQASLRSAERPLFRGQDALPVRLLTGQRPGF